jgi:chemotaxis protein CheD
VKRFWDAKLARWQVCVLPGELYVTRADEVITTVLGSCVSACIRDPQRGVGGLNHFLLPHAPDDADDGATARYGLYALECLVNGVLRGGGRRADLEIKVFGGGRVIRGCGDVGRANVEFVRSFFADEQMSIVSEDVGGAVARRLHYWPVSGRAQIMQLPIDPVADDERAATTRIAIASGSVELF